MKNLKFITIIIICTFFSCQKEKIYTCGVKFTERTTITTDEGLTKVVGGQTHYVYTNEEDYCYSVDAIACDCWLN